MLPSKFILFSILVAICAVNAQHTRKPENWKIDFIDAHGTASSVSGYGGRDCTAVSSGTFAADWTKYDGPPPGNVKNTCCIQQYSDDKCLHRKDNICSLHASLKRGTKYYKIVNC